MSMCAGKCDPAAGNYNPSCTDHFPVPGSGSLVFAPPGSLTIDGAPGLYELANAGDDAYEPRDPGAIPPCHCRIGGPGMAGCICGAFKREMEAKRRRAQA